jgi:hypothetical protein
MRKFVPHFNIYTPIFYLKIFYHWRAICAWCKFDLVWKSLNNYKRHCAAAGPSSRVTAGCRSVPHMPSPVPHLKPFLSSNAYKSRAPLVIQFFRPAQNSHATPASRSAAPVSHCPLLPCSYQLHFSKLGLTPSSQCRSPIQQPTGAPLSTPEPHHCRPLSV